MHESGQFVFSHRSATIESTLASPGGQEAGGGERQMPAL